MQTNPSLNLHSPSLPASFPFPSIPRRPISPKTPTATSKSINFLQKAAVFRYTHVAFCSPQDQSGLAGASNPELELLTKPLPIPVSDDDVGDVDGAKETESDAENSEEVTKALEPFLKLYRKKNVEEDSGEKGRNLEEKKMMVRYYEPKSGDFVVGVVVSGSDRKLDVNLGADMLGTMLTKEVLPLHDAELRHGLFDVKKDAKLLVNGKIGIVKEEEAWAVEKVPGRPVVDVGAIVFAEVLGRSLSGRPLLSTRRLFKRLAWHRVRQIQELNEPIEVRITEWNTGGLLTRIEGLRTFLPKAELMKSAKNYTELKANVGRWMHVLITRVDEAHNSLLVSERQAWDLVNLQEGTLLEGTISKIFTFGAQVMIGETNRRGLLHISKISRVRVESVTDLLKVGEKVKVLVVKSMFPDNISLSIEDLESEPGLFLKDKEKVFSEAEEMAKNYRRKLPVVYKISKSSPPAEATLPFDDEERLYANWKWFRFEQDEEQTEDKTEEAAD